MGIIVIVIDKWEHRDKVEFWIKIALFYIHMVKVVLDIDYVSIFLSKA